MAACRALDADGYYLYSCAQCEIQFMHDMDKPYMSFTPSNSFTDAEARSTARDLAQRGETLRGSLRTMLAQHGNSICSRWKKKSREKRAAILLQVDPSIEHEAHFEARIQSESKAAYLKRRADPHWSQEKAFRASTLPYLNLETLKNDPMRLLSLLHHRSCSKPEDWASYDMSRLHDLFRMHGGRLPSKGNLNCVVMRGARFGELVPHDEKKCHSLEIMGFPTAFIVLQMQYNLLSFLDGLAKNIIGPTTTPCGNDRWLSLTSTGFKLAGSGECWSQFANPFANPPAFDPLQCLAQAEAHLTEAEDHLKLMQTDPEYLHFHIGEGRTVDTLMMPLEKVVNLRWLVKQCEHVAKFSRSSAVARAMNATSIQNAHYDEALAGLYSFASQLCEHSKLDLGDLLSRSAHFRSSLDYYQATSGETVNTILPEQVWSLFREDRLHWYLYRLFSLRPYVTSTEEAFLFAAMEEHLEKADYKERSRVDRVMYKHLASLATFQQIQTDIALCRPHLVRYGARATFHPELPVHRDADDDPIILGDDHFFHELQEFRNHPWPKGKRDMEWLAKAEEVRRRMLHLWDLHREAYRTRVAKTGYREPLLLQVMTWISPDHSTEYRLEVAAERAEVLRQIDETKLNEAAAAASSASVQTVWGREGQESIEIAVDRVKPKTRPADSTFPYVKEPEARDALSDPEKPQARVLVNAESLRIFARLFATGSENSKGIVKWQQIVTALCDAGLVGTNVGGSAVSFRSSSDEGSIVFHKPHPDPNVDLIAQRNMGKRLHKWFGWTAETFVEREKAKKEETAKGEDAQE